MPKFLQYLIPIFTFLVILESIDLYESLAVMVFLFLVIKFVNEFGKSTWLIIDLISLLALFTWDIAPILSYHYFNANNEMALNYDKVMRVNADNYYSFIFPATIAMIIGLNFPLIKKIELKDSLWNLRKSGLLDRPISIGYQFIIIGQLSTFFSPFLPSSFNFLLYLFSKLTLTGLLYLYFSGRRPKLYIIVLLFGLMLASSIRNSMFGEMLYMLILVIIIVNLGVKYNFILKLCMLFLCFNFVVSLQSIKSTYRNVPSEQGKGTKYFFDLMANRLSNPRELFSEETLFGLNHRFNQGWLISVAMDRVPKVVPYANGETIGISLLASLVPRVFWPDKPESGGKYNMERFLGWKNTGFSMNISPVGEAWVNFGAIGGIAFMFSYGLALRFFFYFLIKLTYLTPTLIFWFPLIFFYVIITESDVLTVFNHLIKTSFFVWLIFFTYSKLFGIKI